MIFKSFDDEPPCTQLGLFGTDSALDERFLSDQTCHALPYTASELDVHPDRDRIISTFQTEVYDWYHQHEEQREYVNDMIYNTHEDDGTPNWLSTACLALTENIEDVTDEVNNRNL